MRIRCRGAVLPVPTRRSIEATGRQSRWRRIAALHYALSGARAAPIVELNRAVACRADNEKERDLLRGRLEKLVGM